MKGLACDLIRVLFFLLLKPNLSNASPFIWEMRRQFIKTTASPMKALIYIIPSVCKTPEKMILDFDLAEKISIETIDSNCRMITADRS